MLGIMKSQVHISKMLKVILFALFAQYLCTDFSGASDRMFVSALSVKAKKIQNQDPSGETIEYNQKLSEKPEHVWGGSVDKSGKYPMNANSGNSFTGVNSINGPVDSGNTLMEISKNDNCQEGGSCGNPKSAETQHKEPDSKPDHSDGYSYGNMHRRAISIGTGGYGPTYGSYHSPTYGSYYSPNYESDDFSTSRSKKKNDLIYYLWDLAQHPGRIKRNIDLLRQVQFDNGVLHMIDDFMKSIKGTGLDVDEWDEANGNVISFSCGSIGLCMVGSMLILMVPAWYTAKISLLILAELGIVSIIPVIFLCVGCCVGCGAWLCA